MGEGGLGDRDREAHLPSSQGPRDWRGFRWNAPVIFGKTTLQSCSENQSFRCKVMFLDRTS